ncbi:MAG: universal stress protein [Methanosphaera sp.]|nr:universal stress protein [Methanosphaera sp.]
MYKKILLPTDGSKNSEKAIQHAVTVADKDGSEITILNVVDSVYLTGLPEEDIITQSEMILEEESKKITQHVSNIIQEYADENGINVSNITLTPKTVEGNAADIILKVSEEEKMDIVVIASSGKHMLDRFLLGSVTEKAVRHSKVPILIVPNKKIE